MKILIRAIVVLGFVAVLAGGLRASDTETNPVVAQGMNKVAKAVFSFLDDEGMAHKIVLGQIQGLPNLKASGGSEVRRLLAIALEENGVLVDDDASAQLMGKFRLVEERAHPDDDFDSLGLEVSIQILDENGNSLFEPEIKVWGKQILQIAGLNVDIPAKASPKIQQREIIDQRHTPNTRIAGNEVRTNGPFGVEIIVNNGNRYESRLPHLDRKNRPFVDLHQREEYVVRIHNHADFEAAVTLLIDGVNCFVNSTEKGVDANSKLIVKPGTHIDVPGWFITKTKSKAFEISGYEGSVAQQQGEAITSANIGTITCVYQACWNVGGQRPADEPGGNAKGGKATKQGRDIDKDYKVVVKDFGVVRSTISVRYDR